MRISGGTWGRRPIEAPPGRGTRPTTDRVREALFSLLDARGVLASSRVIDLFAGSGALGLEALSRGAEHATFVERHGPTLAVARRNAASLDALARSRFVRSDVRAFLGREGSPVELVLADPPYDLTWLPELPELVLPRLVPDGVLVVEHDARHQLDTLPGFEQSRTYGGTILSIFCAPSSPAL
ncbi:MAG: 16S rRNA (guanine(966)-N(2))-methyltransferase RsmD [Bacteroidota bacterium]